VPALTIYATFLACGAIGFVDDLIKVRHRRSLGLSGRIKMLLLLAISVVVCIAAEHQKLRHAVFIPIVDKWVPLEWGYYVLIFIVIAGAANAVNLTDGLDGLAAGTSIISLFTLTAIAVTIYIRQTEGGHRIANRLDAAYIGAAII
jgi:phospho-N-acetylmuramoyl-pentapeptide-transferase